MRLRNRHLFWFAVTLAYLGAGFKHGFQMPSIIFGVALFLAFLAYATDPDRGKPVIPPGQKVIPR